MNNLTIYELHCPGARHRVDVAGIGVLGLAEHTFELVLREEGVQRIEGRGVCRKGRGVEGPSG